MRELVHSQSWAVSIEVEASSHSSENDVVLQADGSSEHVRSLSAGECRTESQEEGGGEVGGAESDAPVAEMLQIGHVPLATSLEAHRSSGTQVVSLSPPSPLLSPHAHHDEDIHHERAHRKGMCASRHDLRQLMRIIVTQMQSSDQDFRYGAQSDASAYCSRRVLQVYGSK